MDRPATVVDCGSSKVKAGFSGEEGPRAVFSSIIGTPKIQGIMIGSEKKDYYVGTQA